MTSTTGIVERDDVEIAFEVFGDRSKDAIVLVSGGGASRDWWDQELCRRLADGRADVQYQVVRYDLRDAGESTTGEPGSPAYTQSDLVDDLAAVIDEVVGRPAHLVGMSLGSGLVLQLALRRPEIVRTIALFSSTPGFTGSEEELPPPSEELRASFESESPEPDWRDAVAVGDALIEIERPFVGTIPLDEGRVRRIAAELVGRGGSQVAADNHYIAAAGEGLRDDIDRIAAPTLVLHGDADPLFPLPHGEALARAIPGARLVVIPGHGHQNPPPPTWDLVIPAILDHVST